MGKHNILKQFSLKTLFKYLFSVSFEKDMYRLP